MRGPEARQELLESVRSRSGEFSFEVQQEARGNIRYLLRYLAEKEERVGDLLFSGVMGAANEKVEIYLLDEHWQKGQSSLKGVGGLVVLPVEPEAGISWLIKLDSITPPLLHREGLDSGRLHHWLIKEGENHLALKFQRNLFCLSCGEQELSVINFLREEVGAGEWIISSESTDSMAGLEIVAASIRTSRDPETSKFVLKVKAKNGELVSVSAESGGVLGERLNISQTTGSLASRPFWAIVDPSLTKAEFGFGQAPILRVSFEDGFSQSDLAKLLLLPFTREQANSLLAQSANTVWDARKRADLLIELIKSKNK